MIVGEQPSVSRKKRGMEPMGWQRPTGEIFAHPFVQLSH